MRAIFLPGLFALAVCGEALAQVTSDFASGADGWMVSDVDGGPSSAAIWDAGAQRLVTADLYRQNSFVAPAKFLGDLSARYGGTLSFDIGVAAKDAAADSYFTLMIRSAAGSLWWFGGSPSTVTTTSFSATLSQAAGGWRLNSNASSPNGGSAPTPAQFQAVLGGVTAVLISADWLDGPDTVTLDNVVLSAVPEPAAVALMVLGLAGVVARSRRLRSAVDSPDARH
jgi:hypothetical protein